MECLLLKNSLQLNPRLVPEKLSSEQICPLPQKNSLLQRLFAPKQFAPT